MSKDPLETQAALIEASARLAAEGMEAASKAAERLAQNAAAGKAISPAVMESQVRTQVLERALQARLQLAKSGKLSPQAQEALQHQVAALRRVLSRYEEAGAAA